MPLKKLSVFIFTLLLFGLTPVYAYAATLSISPATGQLNKGCDATVTVELDTQGAQTDGTDVILTYDPSRLSITQTDITHGKVYADYPGDSVDSAAGKISVSGIASVSEAYSGKGTFASLKFKVAAAAAAGSTTLKFDFDPNNKSKTTDSNVVERGTVADVLNSVTDGNFTIGSGPCTQGIGAPASSSLPISNPVASSASVPTKLPEAGLLDNTIMVASIGTFLVILGIAGIALL